MTSNDLPARLCVGLDRVEALRLLGSVPLGRIVFTRQALPAVRPVSHVLDGGDIVIRTHEGVALTTHARQDEAQGVVVAYEADAIDPDTRLGWSVVVTGRARLVTDPGEVARIRARLEPWAAREGREGGDHAVRIRPDLVTGVLLTDRPGTGRTPVIAAARRATTG
ncbi:pyridoxamine 5'-phosphate oxidase [Streptomyces sp. MUSC 14]|uniref:pyridoxamine 5'-phosphate oxidase family protein n=1 Tax=Streptomyces sp. MUSC 14 TaxID=1354889 RepID=UPI0008F56801|nr:pyridoxamine 5'-phosphate oxidase family protein [Streptomyces sp. MUSC 14]OIJ90042.1 pyridoxamine 5'-phosphate oxidase [Streptomyces sp. MUSC 14]